MISRSMMVLICLFVISSLTQAIPIPALDLAEMTKAADLIVIGRVTGVSEAGQTKVNYNGQTVDARRMRVNLKVERLVKGRSGVSDLSYSLVSGFSFSFSVPESDLGYGYVADHQFGMFFLRQAVDSEYIVSNPYYPALAASQTSPRCGGTALEQVILEMSQVLKAGEASPQERLNAIAALGTVKEEIAVAPLRQAVANPDPNVQAHAAAALLWRNDITPLKAAEKLLLTPPAGIAPYPWAKLALALEGIKNPRAVPVLIRLLNSDKVEIRRSAANAIRQIGGESGTKALVNALNDNDSEVRYNAVMGLAEITGQDEWGPAESIFQQDEKRYLDHWREWAARK